MKRMLRLGWFCVMAVLLTGISAAAETKGNSVEEAEPIEQFVPEVWGWENTQEGKRPAGTEKSIDLTQYTNLSGELSWSITGGADTGVTLDADGVLTVRSECGAGRVTIGVSNGDAAQTLTVDLIRREPYCWGGLILSQYSMTVPQSGTVTQQCGVTIYDQYGGVVDPSSYQAFWYLVESDDLRTEYKNYKGITIDDNGLITVPAGAPGCDLKIRVRLDQWESSSCQNGLCIVNDAEETGSEVASGFCGPKGAEESVLWRLDSDGLLRITGTGPMNNSGNVLYRPPWHEYAEQIKTVIVDSGVTEIGLYAFRDCANLADVTLNEGLLKIGTCAFDGCTSLAEIDLPDSVTEIGVDVFVDCPLTRIVLPRDLEVLEKEAFWRCKSMTTVTISEKITSIGRRAFHGSPLTDVYYEGTIAQWNAIDIHPWNGNLTHAVIHCSDGIAEEGENVGGNADAFPGEITLHMPKEQVDIPKAGEAAVTFQPTAEILDQYGQPHTPTTVEWSLYESLGGNSEAVTSLNGVTIDPDSGLITVSADAVDCTIFVCVYAYTFIRDVDPETGSGTGEGNGNAACARLQIGEGGNIPGDSYLYGATIRMPTQTVSVPEEGEDEILIQPEVFVEDQNGNAYMGGYTPHWYLCTEIWGEDVTELNGVSIDTVTGQITVPAGAQTGTIYVHVWVQDERGNGTNHFKSLTLNPSHIHVPSEPVEENRVDATYFEDGAYEAVVYCGDCGKELSRTPCVIPALGPVIAGQEILGNSRTGYTVKAYRDLHVLLSAYQEGKMVELKVLQIAEPGDTKESRLKFFLPEKRYDTLKLFYLTTNYHSIGAADPLDL